MRLSRVLVVPLVLSIGACDALTGPFTDPDAPTNLTYELIPSGDPNLPLGVLLSWDIPRSGNANSFNVYGRDGGSDWQLRATTTSPSFHDAGVPESQYYVATVDENGNELGRSQVLTIDLSARLPAPTGLTSVSLNTAIQLIWNDNAVAASNGTFDHYRVYSTPYDDTRGVCTSNWVVEGTTVSDGFLAGNLANGQSRCFAVSALTRDGHESEWSAARLDTPRFDAQNAIVYATASRADSSGFLFIDDTTQRLGVVTRSTRADLDLKVERHADGTLWVTPGRTGATLVLYSPAPVADLTSVDRAPSSGYAAQSLQAIPGLAYVFRLQNADGVHFAALRIDFVTNDYAVFDWSYQSAPGNVELSRR
ncbi:MAG: hypothetical protein ACHQWU_15050 [Gemmatimonadales bacterium]